MLRTLSAGTGLLAVPASIRRALAATAPDLVLRLTARPDEVSLWPGDRTAVLRYFGTVLHGRSNALKPSAGYLGPTLELRRGERVRIEFHNDISAPSIIHWHGMIVPESVDGHPRFAVGPGGKYVYEFTVRNPAGTYLYHPHPHGFTGRQVYQGLAGLLIVRESLKETYGLPAHEHELSLAIQDRRVDGNQFVFKRTMMDNMNGVMGDTVLVNGAPDASFKVTRQPWRLRLANVSNARIYKLAWSDGRPLRVIATDNGLLSAEEGIQSRPYLVLAPFERVEVLEDFGERAPGTEITLVSREFEDIGMMGGMMGMMGRGMMGGAGQGDELPVARFMVTEGLRMAGGELRLPPAEPQPARGGHEVHTRLAFRHMQGTLNGRQFEMAALADDERLPLDKGTVWTFTNEGGGMAMPHPMHIHGVRFRILERSGAKAPADLRAGLVDAGYKDTFLIFPGEQVRLLVAPAEPGMFLYHCHNLEHEDNGMMRNCRFDTHLPTQGPQY
ncbi:MAG: multicopper oxidase domain-containing protein [Rhodocyclaceae bacterium]|nr:multicopper oxidase domain-containing protein [Rhodocyclaceae bacterium]